MNRVVIVGGGITGLSAAFYLNQAGFRATLIERSARLGGVIRTEHQDGCLLETGPDSFLASKPWALDLIREVGLADQVIDSNDHLRVTYVVRNGKLVPLPDGMMMMVPTRILPLVTTRLLSWTAKIRMGLELFRKTRGRGHDRSVADFLLDHYGQEALDYLAEPLLAGVYGGDPRKLSADSVLPRLVEIEAKFGSLSRGVLAAPKAPGSDGSLFRTLKRGLGQLVEKLAPCADVLRGEAECVEPGRVRVDGDWIEADQIFVATPAWMAAKLLRTVNGELSDLLGGIPYNPSLTLSLGYDTSTFDHPLKGFGFLVPKVERTQMKACTWVNNKFNFRAAPGKVVLRCFFGGDVMAASDESIVAMAQSELRKFMGLKAQPVFSRVTRWPDSMAQYTVGHAARVAKIDAIMGEIPGLTLGGNGYKGIGVPDCVHSGKLAALEIVQRLSGTTATL